MHRRGACDRPGRWLVAPSVSDSRETAAELGSAPHRRGALVATSRVRAPVAERHSVATETDVLVNLLCQLAQALSKLVDLDREVGVLLEQLLVCL